jgi:hypothetical protein
MQTGPRLHSFFFQFFVMTDRGLGAGLGEGGARGLGEGSHASVEPGGLASASQESDKYGW